MPTLGIEQAARASGRTARDIREMIERGVIPATRPAGRWLVEPHDLDRASEWRPFAGSPDAEPEPAEEWREPEPAPEPEARGPIGADPVARVIELAAREEEPEAAVVEPAPVVEPEPVAVPAPAAVPTDGVAALADRLEVAATQIADLRTERDALKTQLREQVSSLKQSLEETLSELDAARARAAELEAARYEESVRREGSPTRAALTPLFRATTGDDQPGSPRN